MPSIRRVSFSNHPAYSRPPRDDEAYVMKKFAGHASHCSSCADPYEVFKHGGTLCHRGHQRAVDVAHYVYNRGGKAYSVVDREGNQRVQVEIPVGCDAVRSLLKAMEHGLRIMRQTPTASYDKTYYIPARPSSTRDTRHLRLETAEPPAWNAESRYTRHRGSSGRGSMYYADMKEREKANAVKPIYYIIKPETRPPVPPKDYYFVRRRNG